jgi:hypothetical protein
LPPRRETVRLLNPKAQVSMRRNRRAYDADGQKIPLMPFY